MSPKANPLALLGVALLVAGVALAAYPSIASSEPGAAEVKVYTIDSIMSGVYKVYGNERLGYWVAKTIVSNNGKGPIYDVKISYKIEGLTEWSEPHVYKAVPPGGAVVDLYYPVITSPGNMQSSAPSVIHVKVEYRPLPDGEPVVEDRQRQITILGMHDFVFSGLPPEENTGSFRDAFSNYELLAAWVTPKDPVVERYADMANQLVGGTGASLSDEDAIKYLNALWVFSVYNGITYQTEPPAYWTGKTAQFVKFARDVIRDRSGTCLDTALFFASLALAHGLNPYIVLIPGHAFPVVQLPSGSVVPIESTMLSSKASFQEAVAKGAEELKAAMAGPHLIVDVASLQAKGIVPPELPELPPNVLEQWGYKLPGGGAGGEPGGGTGGGQGGAGGGEPGGGGSGGGGQAGLMPVSNPFQGPGWTMYVPQGWEVEPYSDIDPFEVDLYSPDGLVMIAVLWSAQYSVDSLRQAVEAFLEESYGGAQVSGTGHGSVGGEQSETIAYTLGDGSLAVTRLFQHSGYNFALLYIIESSAVSQSTINSIEEIIGTFTFSER